jgi:6-phosphogluconolactonase
VQHELVVLDDVESVATSAADLVLEVAEEAVADHGTFSFAVSGGRTPWLMFSALRRLDLPWESVVIYQVDERVAPLPDPDRNLAHLQRALADLPVRIEPMPVEADDLDAAAARYAQSLPEHLDLVHLGLGPDGHTASLVPGDHVLEVNDRLVAVTEEPYQGRLRMTLTYPALARSQRLLWLVTGTEKAAALERLLEGSTAIPAGRVNAPVSWVLADRAARPA